MMVYDSKMPNYRTKKKNTRNVLYKKETKINIKKDEKNETIYPNSIGILYCIV